MAFDGSGNFLRIHNWQQDAANNIDISAPEVDGEDNGFAAGLTLCVTRDGQGKMAADFLPSVASTYQCGSASFPWSTGNFGALNVAGSPVYAGAPINNPATPYTLLLTDANKAIYMQSGGAKTLTIPSNAAVPFALGTMITLINDVSGVMSIPITSDTMILSGTGGTGTRSLAAFGIATLIKVQATRWFISGIGLS